MHGGLQDISEGLREMWGRVLDTIQELPAVIKMQINNKS